MSEQTRTAAGQGMDGNLCVRELETQYVKVREWYNEMKLRSDFFEKLAGDEPFFYNHNTESNNESEKRDLSDRLTAENEKIDSNIAKIRQLQRDSAPASEVQQLQRDVSALQKELLLIQADVHLTDDLQERRKLLDLRKSVTDRRVALCEHRLQEVAKQLTELQGVSRTLQSASQQGSRHSQSRNEAKEYLVQLLA